MNHDRSVSNLRPRAGLLAASLIAILVAGLALQLVARSHGKDPTSPIGAPGKTPDGRVQAAPSTRADGPSLRIGRINLDKPLSGQGLRKGEINPRAGQLIWFTGNGRVKPGTDGISVIAGHVARGNKRDVFADLNKVGVGDEIVVTDDHGVETLYVVSQAYTKSKESIRRDPAVWGDVARGKQMALVTCGDELGLRSDGHRVANFVVIAKAV